MLNTVLLSLVYCALCVLIYFYAEKRDVLGKDINKKILAVFIILAAALRIVPALQEYCFTYDINCFKAWGSYANSLGFKNLYSGDFFLDYPPGYMYILAVVNGIINLLKLDINGVGATFVTKLPSMIADFAIAYLVYRFAQKNSIGKNCAAFAAVAFLFMPSAIFNSAVWGQIESWYILFILLSLYFAHESKTVFAAVFYAVALITKPQALMFGPLLLFYVLRRGSVKEFFKAVGAGAGTMYLLALPFCKSIFDISWLIRLYMNTMGGYQYYTVNAFNAHYLAKLNWVQLPDSTFVSFITPTVIAVSLVFAAYILISHKKFDGFFAAGAVIISLIFAFCTMMHERYLWPAAVLCVLAYTTSRRWQYLLFGGLFGCLCYINSSWVMAMYYQTFNLNTNAERAVSFVVVAVTLCFVAFALYCSAKEKTTTLKKAKKYLNPRIIMVLITILYSFVAFFALGITKAPQTFFSATMEDYIFTVEFDKPEKLGSIFTYSGIGDQFSEPEGQKILGQFEVSLSADGENFDVYCDIDDMSVYTIWISVAVH